MIKKALFIFLLFGISSACFNLNKISLYNLSSQYSNTMFTNLDAVAFNIDRSTASLYIPVRLADMNTELDTVTGKWYTQVGIKYELFESYESKQILDSATLLLTDSSRRIADTLVCIDITYPMESKYLLKLGVTDLNRVDEVNTFLFLDNSSEYSNNNFLLKDAEGEILFRTTLASDEEFFFQLSDSDADQLFVRYYHRDFPLALPPFIEEARTTFNYTADSIFVIPVKDGRTEFLDLPLEGFYHFQTDTGQREGYTVYRFAQGFPEIQAADQMMQPLRYITTKSEFAELQLAEDKKLAVDNFWLDNAGNPSRARAMIQKYYGRVIDANNYFTSYLEGWKTDRGLIYLVYGPPGIVYRGKDIEEWLYGEKGNSNSIHFHFVKVVNPFSDNDYSMVKSPSYKEKWYNIVNTWRR